MRAAEESITLRQQAGLLTEYQARSQIVALQHQAAQTMQGLLPAMQQAAMAIGPESVSRVQGWTNELERARLASDDLATVWNSVGEKVGQTLSTLLTGAQTWREAMAGLFRELADTFLQQLIIQPFSQWVSMQARMLAIKLGFMQQERAADAAGAATTLALKGQEAAAVVSMEAAKAGAGAAASQASTPVAGPGLAIAAMVAMVAAVMALMGRIKHFARGGYVSGPGTSTSDSIPAQLSAGEFVLNAAAVKRVGIGFLEALNGLQHGPRIQGPRLAFAAGGLVPERAATTAPSQSVRIVNVIDPAMAADYLNSSAGEKTILNLLQRNAGAVKQLML